MKPEKCPKCDGYGLTPGWEPSFGDPDNVEGLPESEPCDCQEDCGDPRTEENRRLSRKAGFDPLLLTKTHESK